MKVESQLNKKNNVLLGGLCVGALLIAFGLLICGIWLNILSEKQLAASMRHYKSFQVANQLRRTSDDLTTMVRLYIATGKKKYLNHFNEILDIRNGESLRPEEYESVYWDLVLDEKRPSPFGEKKPLYNMMLKQGFANDEFTLLEQAESLSNNLARIENKAMKLLKNNDSNGDAFLKMKMKSDKELAMKLGFGEEYMQAKAKIMEPIRMFIKNVGSRTLKEVKGINQKVKNLQIFMFVLCVLLILNVLILTALLRSKQK